MCIQASERLSVKSKKAQSIQALYFYKERHTYGVIISGFLSDPSFKFLIYYLIESNMNVIEMRDI